MLSKSFYNAEHALDHLYNYILDNGKESKDTKQIHNVLLEIQNPLDNLIRLDWRNWNKSYADFEFEWYLSANPNAEEISKRAKIWKNLMDDQGNVNSNYGYQWNRNGQIGKVINMLRNDPETRRASISLYDGKEIDLYQKDTICTYAINFYKDQQDKLSMQVMMRSNDLIFGFCNDQYCFSKLMELVAKDLNMEIGTYYHFVCNMHIYKRHFNLK